MKPLRQSRCQVRTRPRGRAFSRSAGQDPPPVVLSAHCRQSVYGCAPHDESRVQWPVAPSAGPTRFREEEGAGKVGRARAMHGGTVNAQGRARTRRRNPHNMFDAFRKTRIGRPPRRSDPSRPFRARPGRSRRPPPGPGLRLRVGDGTPRTRPAPLIDAAR